MTDTIKILNKTDWYLLVDRAEKGDSNAMNEVSYYYQNGLIVDDIEIVKPNPQSAVDWTKRSYESGNLEGMVNYADCLSDSENIYCERDFDLAERIYKEAMNKGSSIASHNLAIEYRNKQNFKKAFELYQNLSRSKEFYPDLSIGLCYYYGIGTVKDRMKAFEVLQTISSDRNSQYEVDEANYLIGKIYLDGEVVEQSIEKARYYLELADIDGDHRSAQELLLIIGRAKTIR